MSPKFQVYKDAAEKFRFRLLANNNQIVAVGEAYEQHASCINGIKSIQKNCDSEIEDLTIEDRKVSNPKYQIFKDHAQKFRFRLKASNGEIIAESEGYETKEGCLNGIEVVNSSCQSEIEDLTESPKPATKESDKEVAKPVSTKPVENTISKVSSSALSQKSGVIFVGNKIPMDYVLAIITGLSASDAKEISLKARGQAITTAVDAAEITRHRFLKDLKVSKITIGTQEMPPREGETRARMVSTIEIVLSKE
jgi:DNA-binding protein Alba